MSNDEIRIAVAECLGWNWIKGWGWKFKGKGKHTPAWYEGDSKKHCSILPNFPKSLDACAEFERTLNENEHAQYACALANCLTIPINWLPETGRQVFRIATAAPLQRCEAYLRIKGRWQDATEGRE